MKTGIHPTYHSAAAISCVCGFSFESGSTTEAIRVELCSNCHPFYTGKQKIVDTARRVERHQARMAKQGEKVLTHKEKIQKREERAKKKAEKKAKEIDA